MTPDVSLEDADDDLVEALSTDAPDDEALLKTAVANAPNLASWAVTVSACRSQRQAAS